MQPHTNESDEGLYGLAKVVCLLGGLLLAAGLATNLLPADNSIRQSFERLAVMPQPFEGALPE
jgi:hypothetical protein